MVTEAFLALLLMGADDAKTKPELLVYTYDSLVGEEGLGKILISSFEKNCQCRLKIWASGDAGQMTTRVTLDRKTKKTSADVVLGIDQNTWVQLKGEIDSWSGWRPKYYERIDKDIKLEPGFLPIDYGYFAFMVDTWQLKSKKILPPKSLQDLLKPEWMRNILLQDPRTSTPGLAFLFFTQSVFGEETWTYWKNLRTQWLTLSQGWDAAYQLFLKGEAPLVWSYTTSEAYHRFHGDGDRYLAIPLKDGAPLQIEGAAILKGSSHKILAQKFLEFLISDEIQKLIPRKQWMYPARGDISLPAEFKNIPKPRRNKKSIMSHDEIKETRTKWEEVVSK